jgi:hypothetical protein
MALEIRYIAMADEGDHGYPKIMRVVYNEDGQAIASSEAPLREAHDAHLPAVAEYYDHLRDYFRSVADYVDQQTGITNETTQKMFEVMSFCGKYISENPAVYPSIELE